MPSNTWLEDAFSDATSKPGRVILYGYDSSESSARCYTLRGVYQEAEALLDKLLSLRSPDMAVRLITKSGHNHPLANSASCVRVSGGLSTLSPTTLEG